MNSMTSGAGAEPSTLKAFLSAVAARYGLYVEMDRTFPSIHHRGKYVIVGAVAYGPDGRPRVLFQISSRELDRKALAWLSRKWGYVVVACMTLGDVESAVRLAAEKCAA